MGLLQIELGQNNDEAIRVAASTGCGVRPSVVRTDKVLMNAGQLRDTIKKGIHAHQIVN